MNYYCSARVRLSLLVPLQWQATIFRDGGLTFLFSAAIKRDLKVAMMVVSGGFASNFLNEVFPSPANLDPEVISEIEISHLSRRRTEISVPQTAKGFLSSVAKSESKGFRHLKSEGKGPALNMIIQI